MKNRAYRSSRKLPRTNQFLSDMAYAFNKLVSRPDFIYKRFYCALSDIKKGPDVTVSAKGLSNYCHISLILSTDEYHRKYSNCSWVARLWVLVSWPSDINWRRRWCKIEILEVKSRNSPREWNVTVLYRHVKWSKSIGLVIWKKFWLLFTNKKQWYDK